ncbi:FAD-dependent monooxygenase [Denitromonas iodatirespirans]|uniref:FAD-dependent monooxygenase n=1 Tax=Denitromonas iodatirespirans TaxID=2795389 RepID=UPI001E5F74F4|nr:FAD-dependent monooxygenase [Denitromonas iodatirespirans]
MKVAILGGGVAGISSAIALKQKGFDVSIYERHESDLSIGAGIVVWPNAAYVLEQLGVLDEIEAVSGHLTRMCRLSSANEDLGAIDIERINRNMGYSSLSILRSEFQRILISRLESLGVAIQYGRTVTRIETKNPDQAEVHFQNGSKITADVLIGADGRMASHARRYVCGDNSPVYQGIINWVGVYESEEESFQEIAVADYWGVGERFGIVPVTKHKAYWAGGAACADVGPRNQYEYKAELRSIFSDWPQLVRMMTEHTPVERINKIYVHDHDPIHTWHKHNLIVIGDAAHAPLPTSGQGACQALEDAWHLANCLNENPSDLQKAFVKFTELRFEKTSGIIMAARTFASSLFSRDERFCMARNENSKNTDFAKVAAAMSGGWSQHLPLNV